jgi:MFS family permease
MSIADTSKEQNTKGGKIFYGWWLVAVSCVINAFGVGTFFYGFSTFFNPMIAEFGWSRTMMSGVFSLSRLEGGIEGPLVGWLIDRIGARRVLLVGVSLTGLGFILLSQVNSIVSLYLIFGLVLSLGFNLGYIHATTASVSKWFIKKRSRAISILVVGNGVGGALFVPLIAWLIVAYGWRNAAIIIGVVTLLVPLPLALFIKSTPEEFGLRPDGEPKKSPVTSSGPIAKSINEIVEPEEEVNLTVREALKTRAFWIYIGSMMLRNTILGSLVVHQIPHLVDIGITYQTAAGILGSMILLSIPGRLFIGSLGDWIDKRILLFFLCLLQGVAILILIHATTIFLVYLFVVCFGLGYGGMISLSISLRADLFGRKNYATISGISAALVTVSSVLSPIFAGYIFDATQSYDIAFYTFTAAIVMAGFLFLAIPKTGPRVRKLT